ncbi:MAG: MMPL family transporter [Fuerstiella sp.]|nr:MMPL family transporter [Fuerstiella sp.]MCP4856320.1 MMPL family transporter [Fuerstiella sp.]
MVWSLKGLRLHNDVAGWLPKNDPQARILAWYEGLFPSKDRILVAWDSASLTDPRLKLLKERLEGVPVNGGEVEGGSPYVSEVTLPSDVLIRMLGKNIPFDDALDRIDGVLSGKGPLKIRFTDAGRSRGDYMHQEILRLANEEFGLHAAVEHKELVLPSSAGLLLEDTGGWRLHEELEAYVQAQPNFDLQLSWPEMHSAAGQLDAFRTALLDMEAPGAGSQTAGKPCIEECFVTPGSLAAVSVSLSPAGVADKRAAVAAVRQAVESVGVPAETVRMGGQPVVNVALNQAVADAAWNKDQPAWNLPKSSPIALSALVSIFLSFVMLRSFRLATLVQAVSFLTVIIAVAIVPLTGTSMNMVLIVMPTLLIVLTTSAAIHLANYWKHCGDSAPGGSVFRAAKTAWLPCALASGTTAIGLASLLASNLVPVRDFGIYSAIGCIISFVIVLYVLPSLMLYWPKSPPPAEELETENWNRFGVWIARNRHLVSASCVLATVAAGWGLRHFDTETKVIRYFPTESRLVQDYVFLEDKLSGVISIDTIVKFDQQARQKLPFIDRARLVRDLQQDVRQHPEISGVLSLASFLDLREADTEDMTFFERQKVKRTQAALERKIHGRVTAEGRDNDEIASLLALPDYSTDWLDDGDALLNRKGDEVWRVTAQTSALSSIDLGVLTSEIDAIAGDHLSKIGSPYTGHVVTGLIPVFLRTQEAVLESLIRSFGMAFVVIAIVMMVVLRSPTAGVFTMLPNLMPVVLVFGLLSWMRLKVDIGTMITASVALGIAVDGTLHLLTWFQELVRRGMPVERAVGKALEHCGPAMWQTSAAVGLGMLALLPADLLLVSRFGWIMAALIFAALVADVIFLPALLGGLLGRLIQRATCRHAALADSAVRTVGIAKTAHSQSDTSANTGHDKLPVRPLKDVS